MNAMQLTPRTVVAAMLFAQVVYVILASLVPSIILRDVFNPLAFGVFTVITVTWARDAVRGLQIGMKSAAWYLVFGVFYLSLVAMTQRVYAMVFNALGRPDWLAESMFAGYWPYQYGIAGILILYAAGAQEHGDQPKSWRTTGVALFIGGMVAGAIIAWSIPSVI